MQKTARLKKIARHLLATTCLTVAAAGIGHATTLNESTDFGNTFALATPTPLGTDVVNGNVGGADGQDFFVFSGLTPFAVFSYVVSTTSSPFAGDVTVFNTSNSTLAGPTFFQLTENGGGAGFIPGDGILVVGIDGNEGTGNYSFSLTAPLDPSPAPEPSTMVGLGLGLAGGLALKRRQKA